MVQLLRPVFRRNCTHIVEIQICCLGILGHITTLHTSAKSMLDHNREMTKWQAVVCCCPKTLNFYWNSKWINHKPEGTGFNMYRWEVHYKIATTATKYQPHESPSVGSNRGIDQTRDMKHWWFSHKELVWGLMSQTKTLLLEIRSVLGYQVLRMQGFRV